LIHAAGKDQVLFFNAKHLVSVAPDDGKEYWSLEWETEYDLNVTTPLFIEDTIFISTGYGAGSARLKVAADADGALRVEAVYKSKQLSNHVTNIIHHDGYLYGVDGWQGFLTCLDFGTGKRKWRARTDKGHMVLADGRLIILFENGKLAWFSPTPRSIKRSQAFNSPATTSAGPPPRWRTRSSMFAMTAS
jgi:outer membrane protein assembly factor BamB